MMIPLSKVNVKFLIFALGFCFGLLVGLVVLNRNERVEVDPFILNVHHLGSENSDSQLVYQRWLSRQKVKKQHTIHQCHASESPLRNLTLESQFLHKKVKIACIIFHGGDSEFHQIYNSWAKRCNVYYFVGSDTDISSYVSSIVETQKGNLTHQFYKFIKKFRDHSMKLEDSMWFLFAVDSNLFVIVENLRHLLAGLDHREPYYLGRTVFEKGVIFNVAEAGFVLSRGAMQELGEIFKKNSLVHYSDKVDVNLGKIFMDNHIVPFNTRDEGGCTRFHSKDIEELFGSIHIQEMEEVPCISKSAVSFTIKKNLEGMYTLSYLLYRARIVDRSDFSCDILPHASLTKDDFSNWVKENKEFFGMDPRIMSEKQFYRFWHKQVDQEDLIF